MAKKARKRDSARAIVNAPFAKLAEQYRKSDPDAPRCRTPKPMPANAFAVRMKGDLLKPKVRDGQFMVMDGSLPKAGDLAVFWPAKGGEPVANVLCHELVGYPLHPESECIPIVRLKVLNPAKEFDVPLNRIGCIAKVCKILPAGAAQ
jgi:hypothetical protein